MIHFDTSFVVDFLRETSRLTPGPASHFLDSLDDAEISISVFVECELFAGVALAQRAEEERKKVADFCSAVRTSYPDAKFAEIYGRIAAALRQASRTVSAMDLLIATAAIREDARLVTRNQKDFVHIAGLEIVSY